MQPVVAELARKMGAALPPMTDEYRHLAGIDPDGPHLWRLTMALQFRTGDERYAWLDGGLGVWEGEFDETTKPSVYRAFLQSLDEEGGRA